MHILGVRVDNFSKEEILEKIEFFLDEPKFHQVATINPEFILRAQEDKEFKNILNRCELNIADGIGLKYAFARYGTWLKSRFAGADLMQEIFRIANEKKSSLFLAIHPAGLSSFEEIKKILNEKYPNIRICGENINPKKTKKWPSVTGCDILLCNFGFPRQEKFIDCVKNDTIKLAMGVGGSFDFVTGKLARAPKIMRILGLEWLWRLILQPGYRVKRVFRAVFVFPFKIILNVSNNE